MQPDGFLVTRKHRPCEVVDDAFGRASGSYAVVFTIASGIQELSDEYNYRPQNGD